MSQLINMMLIGKDKDNKSSKLVIVKKEKDGTKKFQYIDDLKFSYYVNKPEYVDIGMQNFIDKEKVNKVICRYDELYKNMALNSPNPKIKEYYYAALNSGDTYKMLKEMHFDYNFHGTDKNIVDAYITKFYAKNDPDENLFGLKKGFIDIEVDGSEIIGFPKPEEAECPINVITLVVDSNVYSYCLKYDTETYQECMDNLDDVKKELEDKYKDSPVKFNFHIYEFDEEIELIKAMFKTINEDEKPDFALAWNAGFDFQYIVNRIIKLGYEPIDICCPEELVYKKVRINMDHIHSDPADKTDSFEIGGYTVWLNC